MDMSVEQINTARNALSKGEDIREEMLLVVGPHVSWEDFLTPAPMCVCLLGELMVIATKADFTLENNPPTGGFKLMRWPSSFRASLMQVANCGYDAFSEAHTSMDQIRLLSLNVPRHLLDAVNILLKGSDEEIEDMLPRPLQAIQKVADQGVLLATSVEAKFSDVMGLTAELLESCVGARGKYETDLKETEVALAIARENKKTAEERKELSTKAYNELEKSVKDAEKAYYKAMDSMPNGWQIIGMNVVEGIGDAFTTVLSGVSRAVTLGLGTPSRSKKPTVSKNAGQAAARLSLDGGTIKAYQAAILLKTYTDTLLEATTLEGTLRKNLRQNEDKVMYAEKQYQNILGQADQKGMNFVNDRVIGLCETGIHVCSDIKKLQRNFQVNSKLDTDLLERILSLHGDVVALEVEGKTVLWSNPTETRAPNQRVMSAVEDTDGSAAQQHIRNTRFKIQEASAQLEFVREKYDDACDRLQDSSQKLGEVMAEIAKLDIQKIDFENIRQTLVKGIKALGELREQWSKMVLFFQMISNLIKCSLNTSLEDFTCTARTSQKHSLKGYPVSALMKDMIYQQAFQAAKLAHVVNMISGCYVRISNDHLTNRLAGLGKLLGFDPEKDATKIQKEREQLFLDCSKAQNEIRALVMQHRREFDQNVEKRIRKIKEDLENVLPSHTSLNNQEQRNSNAIEIGMRNARLQETCEGTRGLDPEDFV